MDPVADPAAEPWHARAGSDVLALLGSSSDGLSAAEALSRLARYGPNTLPRPPRPSLPGLFLRQFRSPLIYLLLAAAAISALVSDLADAGFILAVLIVDAAIGTIHEQRASASADALRAMVRQRARVRRGGTLIEIDAAELVPGDLVLLETGSHVPADLRLLDSNGLAIDESLLTGEAMPVEKSAARPCSADAPLAERVSMAHAGTAAVRGRGLGVVVATGPATEIGRIDHSLRTAPPAPPPLMLDLARLSRQVAIGATGTIAAIALVLAIEGTPLRQIFLLALALTVSAIPEGLQIAVTVALAAAARRMAERNVIVRTLPAVEGLGACTLIATDKTGTLTLNRLSVEAVLLATGERVDAPRWEAERERLSPLALAGAACNEAGFGEDGDPVGDSVDVALLRFHARFAAPVPARIATFAYEPANRFASVTAQSPIGVSVYAKGAIETIAAMCDDVAPPLIDTAEALARQGYRVIALAHGLFDGPEEIDLAAPRGLTLLGCMALIDPLRPEARDAIAACAAAGVEVRMITGDHPETALTIARELGLAHEASDVVTGAALSASPNRAGAILRARVFARIDPLQKLRIVEALRAAGHIVAVTGDGVNDAPALQAANIGVAMGRGGTDVARAAADLVLADDNFASIVAGIEEGRLTFSHVRRIVIFLLATGVAEIAIFVGAILSGMPMPLVPVQVLWLNLVTEGAQVVMLGFGRSEGDELRRAPRPPGAPLVDRDTLSRLVPVAIAMALVSLGTFAWTLARGASLTEAQNAVLLSMVLCQNMFALSVRSLHRSLFAAPFANPWLILGVLLALVAQGLAMTLPPLQAVLGTAMPDLPTLLGCLAGAAVVLSASEATKLWRRG